MTDPDEIFATVYRGEEPAFGIIEPASEASWRAMLRWARAQWLWYDRRARVAVSWPAAARLRTYEAQEAT